MKGYLVSFNENANMLCTAVNAMSKRANIQCNKLMKLDNTMLMYGIYNAEMLKKLINTVHEIHNVTSSHEKIFAGEHNPALFRMLYCCVRQCGIFALIFYFSSSLHNTCSSSVSLFFAHLGGIIFIVHYIS